MTRAPKSISPQRLAANRANAVRSTGPRTAEGKARSAQNARKHGFAAANFPVVRLEELDSIANLKADLVAVYRPVNSQELFAIERIALAQQALLRCAALETGLFTSCLISSLSDDRLVFPLGEALTGDIQVTRAQNRAYALAHGFEFLVRKSNAFSVFLRYQAQTERLYRRAIEEFERLKALRRQLPNEPIVEAQPPEAKPLTPPESPAPPPAPPPTAPDADPTVAPLSSTPPRSPERPADPRPFPRSGSVPPSPLRAETP